MALLYYSNLGVPEPERLRDDVFHRLGSIYKHLERTAKHLESDEVILRLGWRTSKAPDFSSRTPEGAWVELVETEDRRNEPDSTFRAFFDENNREVIESEYPQSTTTERKNNRRIYNWQNRLSVLDRDPDSNRMLLDRLPTLPCLLLRPDTYTLNCQIRAIKNLQDSPSPDHLPLLRLLETSFRAQWPWFEIENRVREDWIILKEDSRPGTEEQRRFVEICLNTPDFAFLEGPPGSGKTTAICELVLQLVRQGKRVLLCASTHVAVDNVLERLKDKDYEENLVPVRIGDKHNISDAVRDYQLELLVETEKNRINRSLAKVTQRSDAQETLLSAIRSKENRTIEEAILSAANLVCGTTIGILQHPDIRKERTDRKVSVPQFDYLILDEASKTTFQEFLVPALLAKRWIIVGDPRQLSPFVDEESIAINVRACHPTDIERNACVDVFLANQENPSRHRTAIVVSDSEELKEIYEKQAWNKDVKVSTAESHDLPLADIVIASESQIEQVLNELPMDASTIRGDFSENAVLFRRSEAWRFLNDIGIDDAPVWEREVGWRLVRLYEQRMNGNSDTAKRYEREIQALLPVSNLDVVRDGIDRVKRIALPSVLESLQGGLGKDARSRFDHALQDGLPEDCYNRRHILLDYQHRMHPDISAFSREHIYEGKALKDPQDMEDRRNWKYPRYAYRAVWIDVKGNFKGRTNSNREEASTIIAELKHFTKWAASTPPEKAPAWEVAILTFYRGQERELRRQLQRLTQMHNAYRHFKLPQVKIELCTVDKFQGHEADIVYISIANRRATSFLESPNRLNVAITRARFQRVIVGNRDGMKKTRRRSENDPSLLEKLVESQPWDKIFGDQS